MSKSPCVSRFRPVWALLALGALASVPPAVVAAERVVLGEEFTATW